MDADRITSFPPFGDLPADELSLLAGAMSEVGVDAGASIVTHGDFGYVLYAIEAGEADVVVNGSESARVLGPGDTFGEIALLVTGRRTASVVARTEMRLLSLFDQDFQRIHVFPSSSARFAGSAASDCFSSRRGRSRSSRSGRAPRSGAAGSHAPDLRE